MNDPEYQVKIYNKLVRDKIPSIIRSKGCNADISIIEDDEEFHLALAEKLVEEAHEYVDSKSVIELADILEIIETLLLVHKISLDDLLEIKKAKLLERGAFHQRIKLLKVHEQN